MIQFYGVKAGYVNFVVAGSGKTQIIVSLITELYSASRKFDLPEEMKIMIITPFDSNADDLCYRMQRKGKRSRRDWWGKFFLALRIASS